ncbi:LIM domain transcription factor LMO4-A isoform X2 [Homalodisca vitripennis]|uniref:LIM domain transcription factor LMO4-A isoform X2 n=1 Tax=Homalodisca vitripennis TaxID=197043 RepID=UPI001EEB223F|nr:LIM domain transcription factor LMO4-A isoform X2 [Homalodisca vitripennis]
MSRLPEPACFHRYSLEIVKLAATTTMNPHYHPYTELSSPHSPPPDNSSYHGGQSNGHGHVLPHPAHHEHHHPHPAFQPPHHPLHHHHHHHMNNNNNNNNNNNQNCGSVKVCAGCGGKIVERFLLHALDRYWHNSCLKCSCCGALLADLGTSCFTKANMILCKADYIRLFGNSGACSACGHTIPASEFVMRAGAAGGGGGGGGSGPPHHVFHLKCFACSKCGAQLVQGDRYYLLAGSLVCEQDWHKLLKGSAVAAGPGTGVRKGKVGRPRRSRD